MADLYQKYTNMETGNIIVIEPESRYKKIDKSLIENSNIDCLTLGIYTKIISFGKTWSLKIDGLSSYLGLSDAKIRRSISILEQEGYILRTPARNERGQILGWNYTIYPTPIEPDKRSRAGGKSSIVAVSTKTPSYGKTVYSENGGDNNNKLNKLKKEKENNIKEKESKNSNEPKILPESNKKNKSVLGYLEKQKYAEIGKKLSKSDIYLMHLMSSYKLDACVSVPLLRYFDEINARKSTTEREYKNHFENWLRTDNGKKAIADTKKTIVRLNGNSILQH